MRENIINKLLIKCEKIFLPPLHIKLGLMKKFVKAIGTNGPCFEYIDEKIPLLSPKKVKAGIFDGRKIKQLIKYPAFIIR